MESLEQYVASVRKYSREIVRELGMLSGCADLRGLSNSEVHTMIEIERAGSLSGAELSRKLCLEKSTVSRLLKGLISKKAVSLKAGTDDRRKQYAHLTSSGKRLLAQVHADANSRVESALQRLTLSELRGVVDGLGLYARSLHSSRELSRVQLRPAKSSDDDTLRRIILESLTEYGANGPGFASMDAELTSLSKAYREPGHYYVVAEEGGVVLGGAGIAPLTGGDKTTCELRKMYLESRARGKGIGRLLIEECLQKARELGYKRCYLETLCSMRDAINMYERYGFKRLSKPLGDTGHYGCDCWMLLSL